MVSCILCSTDLSLLNTPMFGQGKLSDGNMVCTSCYRKINSADSRVALRLKHHSVESIVSLLQERKTTNPQGTNAKGCLIAFFFLFVSLLVYMCSTSSDENRNYDASKQYDDIIYVTNGDFLAAISEEYLDEALIYIADDDKDALDKFLKKQVAFRLNPNREVILVREHLSGKVEFKFKGDRTTTWTRREALGRTKTVGREMKKKEFEIRYGEEWPFIVDKVTLRCIELKFPGLSVIHAIILEVNGKWYAVNGTARNWAQKNGYSAIDEILNKPIPLGGVIQDGLMLCD